jgi:hypothetical protein
MPGNHQEGRGYSLDTLSTTSYGTVEALFSLPSSPFSPIDHDFVPYGKEEVVNPSGKILFLHTQTIEGDVDFFGTSAEDIMHKYAGYQYIVTGDNHKHFMRKEGERVLFNPGCATVQTVDFIDTPLYVFEFSEGGNVRELELPKPDISFLSRAHIDEKNLRNEKIQKFVESLPSAGGCTFDLKANILDAMKVWDGSPGAKAKVWEVAPFLTTESA